MLIFKKLVSQTLHKFRKLSDHREFAKFSSICDEEFSNIIYAPLIPGNYSAPEQDGTSPEPGKEIPSTSVTLSCVEDTRLEPTENQVNPNNSIPHTPNACIPPQSLLSTPISSVSTRSQNKPLTPRKKLLKRQLLFVSQSNAKVKHELKDEIKDLKKKLKTPKRIIKQAVQRKVDIIINRDQTIRQLKRQLYRNTLYKELVKTKREMDMLKITHQKLLNRNKGKAKKNKLNNVLLTKHGQVLEKMEENDTTITELQNENIVLQDSLDDIQLEKDSDNNGGAKVDGKSYSAITRLKVFDCIVNKVPTANIPVLLKQLSKRCGTDVGNLPHRNTTELMARELGAISELQVAETVVSTGNVTLGFEATTEDGVHVNSIHFTTNEQCLTAAVDELAGSTGSDYANHITQTVDTLSETYSYFNDENLQDTRNKIINSIANTMTDRCAANGVAIREIGESWHKTLNKLNCHLHPLDTIASSVKSTLKKLETQRGSCYGQECIAGNVVVKVNRIRYKDGKGDPRGFKAFLDKNISLEVSFLDTEAIDYT